jgi:hypothetical protein
LSLEQSSAPCSTRERGQVSVAGEVAGGAERHEQIAHTVGVPLARVNDGCNGRSKAAFDELERPAG